MKSMEPWYLIFDKTEAENTHAKNFVIIKQKSGLTFVKYGQTFVKQWSY